MITIERKLANILANFHRCSPYPEADADDVLSAVDAIKRAYADAVTEAFRDAQAEVPVDNSLSRWAGLADMQDRLAKQGLCGPSTSPAPTLVGRAKPLAPTDDDCRRIEGDEADQWHS